MSLVTFSVVAITAFVTAICTFFFSRQLSLRKFYSQESELSQCKEHLAILTQNQAVIDHKLKCALDEKQSLLIDKKHLETSLAGLESRYAENTEELSERKNKIAEYEQHFQQTHLREGQAQEQATQLTLLHTEKSELLETLKSERTDHII